MIVAPETMRSWFSELFGSISNEMIEFVGK
jgi:hypothetical protein